MTEDPAFRMTWDEVTEWMNRAEAAEAEVQRLKSAARSEPARVRAAHKVTWLTQDCPCCNADWRGAEIDECERDAWGGLSHYSTVYWRRSEPETVIIFECPKCGTEFVTNEGRQEAPQ